MTSISSVSATLNLSSSGKGEKGSQQMKVQIEPVESHLKATVQPLNRPVSNKAFIYFQYKDFGFKLEMEEEKIHRINQIYDRLNQCIAPDSSDFSISLSYMNVSYTQNNVTYEKDFSEIIKNNDECKQLYESLMKEIHEIRKDLIPRQPIEAGRKAPSHSPIPLCRNNLALEALPKTYCDSAKLALKLYREQERDLQKQEAALRRILVAERMIHSQTAVLHQRIEEKVQALQGIQGSNPNDARIKQLEQEILILKQIYDRFKKIDRFAIAIALAFYPQQDSPSIQEIETAAHVVKSYVQKEVDKNRHVLLKAQGFRARLPEFIPFSKKGIPIPHDGVFSTDVGGLMFTAMDVPQKRISYRKFCDAYNSERKTECLEEAVIRFVLKGEEKDLDDLKNVVEIISDVAIKNECFQALTVAQQERNGILTQPLPIPAKPTVEERIEALGTYYHF